MNQWALLAIFFTTRFVRLLNTHLFTVTQSFVRMLWGTVRSHSGSHGSAGGELHARFWRTSLHVWSTSYLVFLCFICATLEWLCTGTRQLSLLLYLPNADQTSIQTERDHESSTSMPSLGSSTSDSSVEINPSSAQVRWLSEQIHFDGAHLL